MAYDQLNDTYIDGSGQQVPAAEYDALVELLNMQLQGALVAAGTGVINGGGISVGTGLSVLIEALALVVNTSAGYCYLTAPGSTTLTGLPDNSTLYITAAAVIQAGGGSSDSRQFGTIVYDYQSSATAPLGSMVLAKVITVGGAVTSITDLRTYLPASALAPIQAALTAVEAALGTDYFPIPASAAATITDRLTALETAGSGGSGPLYANGLQLSAADAETLGQKLGSLNQAITALQTPSSGGGSGGGTVITLDPAWDVDADNQATALLARLKSSPVDEALAEFNSQTDAIIIVTGVCGDGSNGTANYKDPASTW